MAVCYTKTALRGDLKHGCITLSGVPVSAESLVCLFRDADANIAGLTESVDLELRPGSETQIESPDFAASAAELGERLSLLRLTPSAPVKLGCGEKAQLKAEGVFACRNGAELSCDLSSSGRLVWESSNNSVLRSLGGGRFKALSGGAAKIYASMGRRQAEADVIVKAASAAPQSAEPAAETVPGDPAAESDPAAAVDPVPAAVERPCSLKLDLSRSCLPSDLTLEVRGYDDSNQLRFRKAEAGLKETLEADQSVTKLAGVLLEKDGQVYGIFSADVSLQGKKDCCVSDPVIVGGSDLAAYGEMVISSDRALYDLNDEKIYEKADGNGRCVSVRCSAEVRYTIIPGVWAYSTGHAFLEKFCSFSAEDSETNEYGVFRFFEAGNYTVTVSYRGITGLFAVTVTDSSAQAANYKLGVDLSASNLPAGATYELRGYSGSNELLFSEQNLSDLNTTFENVDKNITRAVGVITASNGEPYAFFEQNVSLRSGEVCQISQPALLTGEQLARQKGSLSFSVSSLSYDLKDKNANGYVAVSTSPSLTYNYTDGWSVVFSREAMRAWDGFSLSCSPYLEYYSSSYKYRLKVYETGQYTLRAAYRGLTSQPVQIGVIDTAAAPALNYRVDINFAASGLPAGAAQIYCQLFHEGAAVSEEFSRSNASSLSFDNVSSAADGAVIKVIGASGKLIGLLYQPLSFNSEGKAVLNGVSVSSGADMDAYIKSFTASPVNSLKRTGEYLTGTAQAELSFNSGKIVQTRDVSAEASWSSSDMTQGTADNSWRVARAGESSLRASLGGGSADIKVYASGAYNNNLYKYAQTNLNSGRAVTLAVYTPDDTSSKGAFNGKIAGGTPSDINMSADILRERPRKPADESDSAELEIRARDAEAFSSLNLRSGGSKLMFDSSENFTKTIDYTNAKTGDTISNLYNHQTQTYYDAKVVLGVDGITFGNYRTSGKIIILSQIVDGQPLIDTNKTEDMLKILEIDYMMGKRNPFDKEGKPVLDRLRQDVGHECGYGVGGGISETEKVVISIVDFGTTNVNAYTVASNSFPRCLLSVSNEAEMITFNQQRFENWDVPSMCSNFAHEFGHMVSFNTRSLRDMDNGYIQAYNRYTNRESDLEEGRADLCSLLCGFCCDDRTGDFSEFERAVGYSLSGRIWKSYFCKADDRRSKSYAYLREIGSYSIKDSQYYGASGSQVISNYGQGFFFVAYLYDCYGLEAVNAFYNSSYNDPAYQNITYQGNKKDYDLLAYVISQSSGSSLTFSELFQDYGKALLLNGADDADNIPVKYRLYSIKPGQTNNTEISDVVWAGYDNTSVLPTVTPGAFSADMSASNIVPWSLNYYLTPNMTYSAGASTSVFGMWGGLKNAFKIMLFNNSLNYSQDVD